MKRCLTYLKDVIRFLFLIKCQIIYLIFHYLNWPKKKQCKEIFLTFKNKNVLILGAGESLSRLNQEIGREIAYVFLLIVHLNLLTRVVFV